MRMVCDREICTGCGLCISICPVSCIMLTSGKLGHLFPKIDSKKCVSCGLCVKQCPALNPIDLSAPLHAFAAWSKDDDDYKSSTSGGASSVFAQYVINLGGVVYGCAVLANAAVEHIRITKQEDLSKIKGSKYVQSSITKVLPQVKDDIKKDRIVLFLGTPCQVAAVKQLFPFTPNKLILVDLVCHGVPSQESLHNYLKRHVSLKDIDEIKFREEDGFVIRAYSKGVELYSSLELWNNRHKDYYYDAFMDGFSYRDSCYQCRYASPNRCSDITIGDFWGLGTEAPDDFIPEHRYGVSLVLPTSNKGMAFLEEIADAMFLYERPLTEAINGNEQLRHPKAKTRIIKVYRSLRPCFGDKGAYQIVRVVNRVIVKTKKLLTK